MSTQTAAAITFKRLKDGAWGVQGKGACLRAGQTVTVTKKSGDSTNATIGRVLFTGADGY